MTIHRSLPQKFSAHRKSEIFFGAPIEKLFDPMTSKKLSGHATATVTSTVDKFGPLTRAAIDSLNGKPSTASPGVGITAAWFDEYPIGPSDYYLRTGKIEFGPGAAPSWPGAGGPIASDLLYRPNDHLRLSIDKAGYINGVMGIGAMPTEKQGVAKPTLAQVGGDHYAKLAIDPFDYAMANKLDPLQMTVVKYVTRFRDKGGVQDLRKAIHTLERLIAHEEKKK